MGYSGCLVQQRYNPSMPYQGWKILMGKYPEKYPITLKRYLRKKRWKNFNDYILIIFTKTGRSAARPAPVVATALFFTERKNSTSSTRTKF